jgi:large subunit ribosomal protein L29
MKAEKIRNLTDVELKHQERDLADQLFKLKFQMNMGQTESLKKIRGLRRDIARVQTVLREQELSAGTTENGKTAPGKTASSPTATSEKKLSQTKLSQPKLGKTEKR